MYTKQVRWEIKPSFDGIFLLSNNCTENYWNRTTAVKVIDVAWAVYFLQHSVETYTVSTARGNRSHHHHHHVCLLEVVERNQHRSVAQYNSLIID